MLTQYNSSECSNHGVIEFDTVQFGKRYRFIITRCYHFQVKCYPEERGSIFP